MTSESTAFEFRNITKRFGEVLANDHVSFAVKAGSIHGVVGENGAGKSTILKTLYGMHSPDSGEIFLKGKPVQIHSPTVAIEHGIGMVHQHFMLLPSLPVWKNIILGNEPSFILNKAKVLRELSALQNQFGFEIPLEERVEHLPVSQQQQVELLKLVHRNADVLILDEPTAVLTPHEVDTLFVQLKHLASAGKTIILITHKLREVLSFTQNITVMRSGRVVATRDTPSVTLEELAELIVGRKVSSLSSQRTASKSTAKVEALNLSLTRSRVKILQDLSFSICNGEIVGFAGVSGNGQEALVEILGNIEKNYSGSISIAGQELKEVSTYDSHQNGLAFIPSDRLKEAVVPDFSMEENLLLAHHYEPEYLTKGPIPFLRSKKLTQIAASLASRFDIRPPNPKKPFRTFSGGNQQKVVIARETSRACSFVLAAFPTRGVDLGATEFIHQHFLSLREQGTAIALFSCELDEILSLSDRVYVLFQGKIVAEFRRGEISERELGVAMTGGKSK